MEHSTPLSPEEAAALAVQQAIEGQVGTTISELQQQIAGLQEQAAATAINMQHTAHAAQTAAAAAQAAHSLASSPVRESPMYLGKLKLPQPEAYSGMPTQDIDTFTFKCEEFCHAHNMASDAALVAYAGMCLRGPAAVWWRAVSTTNDRPGTWQEFTATLKRQFAPINALKTARDALASLRQERGVQAYTTAFRLLALQIRDLSPAEALDRYLRGLKSQCRAYAESKDPTSVEEAAALADRHDQHLHRCSNGYTSHRSSYAQAVRTAGPAPMELGAMRRAPPRPKLGQKRRPQGDDAQRAADRLQNACFRCHQQGHRAMACPTFQMPSIQSSKNGPRR